MSKTSKPSAPGGERPASDDPLRRRAEDTISNDTRPPGRDVTVDPRRLVHELEVHQVELEMQNQELRGTRNELEAALTRYTRLFEFAPIGYVILDGKGTICEINRAAARLLGPGRRRLVGRRLASFLSQTHLLAFGQFVSGLLADRGEGTATCDVVLTEDELPGDEVDLHLTATRLPAGSAPLPGSGPGPVAAAPLLLLALEDVTPRKRAEAALREEARHKDEFLGALSHELRNPLAAVRTALYLVERAPPSSEAAIRGRAVLQRQVGHLARIVDDLLDITRIAHGKIQLQRQTVDLTALVSRTLDDYEPIFDRDRVSLRRALCPERLPVYAD
ncbi:MAG: PAS domain S-box protein, partial [Myxococcales bacterium]|nr:PAS domain S-box protein [Myxococcales bacterium]